MCSKSLQSRRRHRSIRRGGAAAKGVSRTLHMLVLAERSKTAQVGGFAMRFVPRFDRFRFRAPLVVGTLLFSLGMATAARAQFANTATVEGNVTDESSAALPGV